MVPEMTTSTLNEAQQRALMISITQEAVVSGLDQNSESFRHFCQSVERLVKQYDQMRSQTIDQLFERLKETEMLITRPLVIEKPKT